VLFNVRIQLRQHDNYHLLYRYADDLHLQRTAVDTETGVEKHLLDGEYVTEFYATAKMAKLAAMTAAMMVDSQAKITVSGGGEFLTHNCDDVEMKPTLADMIAEISRSTPVPTPDWSFFSSIHTDQQKGGVVPMPISSAQGSSLWEAFLKAK